jgi:hypothetical protein
MKDVYANPTIAGLAAAFAPAATPALITADPDPEPAMITTAIARAAGAVRGVRHRQSRKGTPHYFLCGALQLLFLLGYPALQGAGGVIGVEWIAMAPGVVDIYLRSVAVGAALFVALSAVPILAKWALVGRWKPQQFRVWSMPYLRFWIVRTLIQRNPMAVFVGTPLYSLYLRALGARVGRGVAIFTKVPVCTDLITIGCAGSCSRSSSC